MPQTYCILGAGGFIGSHLVERILRTTGHSVIGIDLVSDRIAHLLDNDRITFVEANVHDIDLIAPFVKKADTVISLVALCNPSLYNTIPLDVIDANFTCPAEIVKLCARYQKWLIQFSTSEVYGRSAPSLGHSDTAAERDFLLQEDSTPFILGPVHAQRWTYACAKQLLERSIYASSFEKGLRFTIVRPFNFIGPRMDFIPGIDGEGIPRVMACFMESLLYLKPLLVVDGGLNRRVFTFIDDAIDAIMAILSHPDEARNEIFNIGNPENEVTIAELARTMIRIYRELRPEYARFAFQVKPVAAAEFYGSGYEDSDRRLPDIGKARRILGWQPSVTLENALQTTMAAYIAQYSSAIRRREAG